MTERNLNKGIRETFVRTESLYAALFDLASPVNAPGMVETTLQAARVRAQESEQPWAALYHFNAAWESWACQGELIAWSVLFDGVFKVVVEVLSPDDSISIEQEASTLTDQSALLRCPSGKLTVACLAALGKGDLAPIMVVQPGTYRASLERDMAEEDKHSFLEAASDYPASDGPDWYIRLQRYVPLPGAADNQDWGNGLL